jgi:hypothetical protein
MRINLQVQFENGNSKEITANAADLVAFEEKFNVSVARLGEESKIGHLLFLAWHSEKRTKSTDLAYEEWLSTVDGIGDSDKDPKSEA